MIDPWHDPPTAETEYALTGCGALRVVHVFPDGNQEARIITGTPSEPDEPRPGILETWDNGWVAWDRPDDPVHDLLVDEIVRLKMASGSGA